MATSKTLLSMYDSYKSTTLKVQHIVSPNEAVEFKMLLVLKPAHCSDNFTAWSIKLVIS